MCRLFKPLSSFKYLSNWSSIYCIIGLKLKQRQCQNYINRIAVFLPCQAHFLSLNVCVSFSLNNHVIEESHFQACTHNLFISVLLDHTCQPFENIMGVKARKRPFPTAFLSKALHTPKVKTISMGEMFGNFI